MTSHFWWIIHKDLVSEFRARRVWPAMLLLGIVVALVFSMQMDLPPDQKPRIVGGLLWLAIYFAGMTAVDRSFVAEHEDGCWQGLNMLPLSLSTLFLAKLATNLLALWALQLLLVPLFFLLADLPLLPHAGELLLISALASPGMAAVGSLVSALAAGGGRSGSLLVLVVLPLLIPLLLAAAEGTRLAVLGQIDETWWRWMQLLGAFDIMFVTAGLLLFEYAIED